MTQSIKSHINNILQILVWVRSIGIWELTTNFPQPPSHSSDDLYFRHCQYKMMMRQLISLGSMINVQGEIISKIVCHTQGKNSGGRTPYESLDAMCEQKYAEKRVIILNLEIPASPRLGFFFVGISPRKGSLFWI